VRHDALISIRKGFREKEFKAFLSLQDSSLRVQTRSWGRITALMEFKGD
jgi:hypothetical protein